MLKRIFIFLLVFVVGIGPLSAQITITNTFSPFTVISASKFNENFTTLGDLALNRTNGTISGNITVSNGVTIDGVDLSAFFIGSGKIFISNDTSTAIDVTGGITAGSTNTTIIGTDGKIPALTSSYFADISGANITSLSASNLASGTVPTARLGSGTANNTTFLRGDNAWTALSAIDAVPAGMILFTKDGACPSGYAEYTALRGRYAVGLPSGGTNLATVGTALSNSENRPVGQHTHDIEVISSTAEGGGGAMEKTTSTTGTPTAGIVSNSGSVTGTNAPYIQLMACEKS